MRDSVNKDSIAALETQLQDRVMLNEKNNEGVIAGTKTTGLEHAEFSEKV